MRSSIIIYLQVNVENANVLLKCMRSQLGSESQTESVGLIYYIGLKIKLIFVTVV